MKRFLLFFLLLNNSCTNFLCGKLDENLQKKIDSVNFIYQKSFTVENIPCEFITIDIILKSEKFDSLQIFESHRILYDSTKRSGWQTIDIFNSKGEYVTTHSWHGFFYDKSIQ